MDADELLAELDVPIDYAIVTRMADTITDGYYRRGSDAIRHNWRRLRDLLDLGGTLRD